MGLFVMMVLASCNNPYVVGAGSYPGKQLGVVLDEKLRVVGIESQSAAEQAGVQIGDILLDLTWIQSATPDPSVTATPTEIVVATLDENSIPITESKAVTLPVAIPAPTQHLEDFLTTATVPFSDVEGIKSLTPYGVPLRLRLQRREQVMELTITPSRPVYHVLAPGEGTVTPVPMNYYYY
jgi:hypothetical protein